MIGEEEYLMIRDLAQEQELTTGKANISILPKQLNLDRKTIRKYLLRSKTPSDLRRPQRASKLDSFKSHINQRLDQFPMLSHCAKIKLALGRMNSIILFTVEFVSFNIDHPHFVIRNFNSTWIFIRIKTRANNEPFLSCN